MEGQKVIPFCNLDFSMEELSKAQDRETEIKLKFKHDLYSLALCCNLLIDRDKKSFYNSLKNDKLSFKDR